MQRALTTTLVRPISRSLLRGVLASAGGGGGGASPVIPLNSDMFIVGDSMSYSNGDAGYAWSWQLIRLAGGRFNYPTTASKGLVAASGGNMAIAGETTADYVARKATIAAAVAASSSSFLIIGGIENDFAASIPVATSIANINEVIAACEAAAGSALKRIYVTPVAPTRNIVLGGHASDKTTFDAAFASHANSKVRLLDEAWNGVELCTEADAIGQHSYDKTHQNSAGARLQAENMWSQMSSDFVSGDVFDALDGKTEGLGAQGDFPGSSAHTYGQIATGWSFALDSGVLAPVLSKTTLSGEVAQAITWSGSNTDTGISKLTESQSFSVSIGEKVMASALLSITNGAGDGPPVGLRGIDIVAYFGNSAWGSAYYSGSQGDLSDSMGWTGLVRSIPYTMPANITSLQWELRVALQSTTVDVMIRVAQARTWKL